MEKFIVPQDDLTWRCDPDSLGFVSTEELESLEGTIGQDRALKAIDLGLSIKNSGFNIFVLGEPGAGRWSTIIKTLKKKAADEPVPDDWCYVQDFKDDNTPVHIALPAGKGKELHQDVANLVLELGEAIPKVFEGKEFEQRRNKIVEEYQEKNKNLFEGLEEEANQEGFTVQGSEGTLIIVPLRPDKKPLSREDYEQLSSAERKHIDSKAVLQKERLSEVLRQVREMEKVVREKTNNLAKDSLLFAIGHLFEELEQKYQKFEKVQTHFKNCKNDIIQRVEEFRPVQPSPMAMAMPQASSGIEEPPFDRYRVNLLVDNGACKGAPVVCESNPTYFNLFGRMEHTIHMGNAITNFRMIKAGALHQANGGYLVIDCRELFSNPYSYEALKRCIRNCEVIIEDMTEQFRMIAVVTLKPEPIPLNCKIVLVGTPQMYYLLYRHDPQFSKFFKVKADFDWVMRNTDENVQKYAQYVATRCREEGLLHFDHTGVAGLIEHAARLVEDKNRFTPRFLVLSDLIREASHYATQDDKGIVSAAHVEKAIEAKKYRSNQIEERSHEYIEDGTVLVDTEGEVVGQINGLTVLQIGDYSFGKPARLTVRTYLGKGNFINMEREVKMSGPIHDKGVLILSGFFGNRYAQDKLLSLSATICFEQSYGGIEGDSASSTELYALLSSLSGLPIKQGIAVTGSVNQRGMIQPIGGANEKIEGFFRLCKSRGLTGEQGVIIPIQNVKNLMLNKEVIAAVHEGKFHVWAVSTIDEGVELLTGTPAGEQLEDGTWPEGTVNFLVDRQLKEYAEVVKKQPDDNNKKEKD
jgi:lon-related putative ATP-dependent protease